MYVYIKMSICVDHIYTITKKSKLLVLNYLTILKSWFGWLIY